MLQWVFYILVNADAVSKRKHFHAGVNYELGTLAECSQWGE